MASLLQRREEPLAVSGEVLLLHVVETAVVQDDVEAPFVKRQMERIGQKKMKTRPDAGLFPDPHSPSDGQRFIVAPHSLISCPGKEKGVPALSTPNIENLSPARCDTLDKFHHKGAGLCDGPSVVSGLIGLAEELSLTGIQTHR